MHRITPSLRLKCGACKNYLCGGGGDVWCDGSGGCVCWWRWCVVVVVVVVVVLVCGDGGGVWR